MDKEKKLVGGNSSAADQPVHTEEEIVSAVDQIQHPTSIEYTFASDAIKEPINITPLPVSYAKKVSLILRPVTERFQRAADLNEKGQEDKAAELLIGVDDEMTEKLLDVCDVLFKRYNVPMQRHEMEDAISMSDVQKFVQAQHEVSGGADFLLQPLQVIIGIIMLSQVGVKTSLNSLASAAGQVGLDKP